MVFNLNITNKKGVFFMEIKILGSGCTKCKLLADNTKKALENSGIDATISKVTDFREIMAYGVMTTPALVINEKVVSSGKVLKPDEVAKFLESARQ
jgi:small redox-active disulfide protein 2